MKMTIMEKIDLHIEAAEAGVSVQDLDLTAARAYQSLDKVGDHTASGQTASVALPLDSASAPQALAVCGKVKGETIELRAFTPLAPINGNLERNLQIQYQAAAHRPWGMVEIAEMLPV